MTPSQYKARYENLVVPLKDGTTTTVRVNQYRLRSINLNTAARTAFLDQLRKRGIDVHLRVDTGAGVTRIDPRLRPMEARMKKKSGLDVAMSEVGADGSEAVSSRVTNWVALARYTFVGKGAPEHCQVVLQLAHHWGLASDLQVYADEALGLDCNGFVGNYLWHASPTGPRQPWTNLGLDTHFSGPDAWISGYFHGKRREESWEALNPSRSYLMGMVDTSGNIINGGPEATPGHIVITEPNQLQNRTDSFALWAVESTGAHTPGLWESWYSCLRVKNKVFTMYREDMDPGHREYPFVIAAVD